MAMTIGELLAKYKANPSSLTPEELLQLQKITKQKKPARKVNRTWVATKDELGALMGGKSSRTVTRWETEGKIPGDAKADGGYDLGRLVGYYWQKYQEGGVTEERKESLLFRRAKRETAELHLSMERGLVISRDNAERAYGQVCIEVTNLLRNLSHLMGAQVPPEMRANIEEVAERHVGSILKALETGKQNASIPAEIAEQIQSTPLPADPGVVRQ